MPGALAPRDRVVEVGDELGVGGAREVERPPAAEQLLDLGQPLLLPPLELASRSPAPSRCCASCPSRSSSAGSWLTGAIDW